MKRIKLLGIALGKYALVSDKDFGRLNKYKWYLMKSGYVIRTMKKDGITYSRYMHREVTNAPKDMEVHHKNRIKTDNRRSNLKVCIHRDNMRNIGRRRDNTSGYAGVVYDARCKYNKWQARISVNGNNIHIGSYPTSLKAAKARDAAAIKYHGKFARLNFPISH